MARDGFKTVSGQIFKENMIMGDVIDAMEGKTVEEKVEAAVFGDAIVVVLGGQVYEIRELTMKKARVWQKKMNALMMKVQGVAGMIERDGEDKTAEFLFEGMQEEFVGLVFEYSPELMEKKEEIEEKATLREMYEAVKVVMNIGNPFFFGMKGLMPKPKG